MIEEEKDYEPENPMRDLTIHVTEKGFQLGACLGVFIISPILFIRGKGTTKFSRLADISFASMIFGGLGTYSLLQGKMSDPSANPPMNAEGIKDRAYRLHYNRGQNMIDKYSRHGALASSLAASVYFFGNSSIPIMLAHSLTFSSVGVAGGCLLYGTTKVATYFTLNPPENIRKNLVKSLKESLP